LLVLAILVGTVFGSVPIAPGSLGAMALHRLGLLPGAAGWTPQDEVILFDLRLPRVIGAALVGLALACAGALFQGLFRNPLADPYVVGTSGGASLGAVLGTFLGTPLHLLGFGIVPLAAFVGALAAMGLVYQLARVGGRTSTVSLLLAGFAVSTMLTYVVSLLLLLNDRFGIQLARLYAWLLGGISVSAWDQLAVVGPLILITAGASLGLTRGLNALSLGEEAAERLGVAVERDRVLLICAGALLTAAAVTISGLVGFVGLVVPHVVRLLGGPDNRFVVPAAGLAGAAFLVVADLLARIVLAPTELPVGILTAFVGGPYFIYLLRKSRNGLRA
jgi:iron complex transport system permease protein